MHLLGEEVSLLENLKSSFWRHWLLWCLFLLTVCLDYLSTLFFMVSDGIDTEANNIIRWLAYEWGMVIGVLIGKSLQVFAVATFISLSKKLTRAVLLLLTLLNTVAVINNLL